MKLSDLPPADRKAIRQGKVTAPRPSAVRRRVARPDEHSRRAARIRCHTCGATFARYGIPAERHADEHGGARLELVRL